MNTKEMIVAIVTAMMVVAMFASSAMAITVDGMIDPSDEWNSWKLADDDDGSNPLPLVNGYNISAVWQHYNSSEDKLYFRYDTIGIAGDSDGDGSPHTPSDSTEQWGVGSRERYVVGLDVDNDESTGDTMMGGYSGFDLVIWYEGNTVSPVWTGTTAPSGFVADAKIKLDYPYDYVVEFSINKVSQYMDPRYYRLYGFAGSGIDVGNPEDPLTEPIEVLEFRFDLEGICCHNMEFNGTDSFGSITNHTWTFGDGHYDGPITGLPGVITHQYSSGGTYTVKLSGYNTLGQYGETTKSVYVDKGPTAKATRTPAKIDVNTPTSVTFDGSASHPDLSGDPLRTITYKWEFSDSHPDAYDAVVTRSVTLGPHGTLLATLTVDDSHCESDVTVVVTTNPPEEVPIMTPAGMVALIGMLCIVGAGRILTKGRRS